MPNYFSGRARRDIRINRPWRRACRPGVLSIGTADFSAVIAARHARALTRLFATERVVRQLARRASVVHHQHLHQSSRSRYALRFDVRLTPIVRTRVQAVPLVRWTAAGTTDADATPVPSAHRLLVQRIVERERRIESIATVRELLREATAPQANAGRMPAVPPPAAPRAKPVPMLVRHIPGSQREAAPNATEAPARAEKIEATSGPTVVRPALPTAPAMLSERELGRVTDQVAHAIERRVVAQRERRGQI